MLNKGEMVVSLPIIIYLIVMNLIGLIVMKSDKKRAINGEWRIPEKMLFLVSVLGGSVGTWAGMYLYRHKTKHWYFTFFMPIIFFVQACGVAYLLKTLAG